MLILACQALLALVLVTAVSLAAGAWLFEAFPLTLRRVERVGFCLLCGLGILSLSLFLVGQLIFTQASIIAIFVCWFLLGLKPIFRLVQNVLPLFREDPIPRIPGLIVLVVLSLVASAGLAEVTGDRGSDTVAYHLLGPKVWLRTGQIRPVLDSCLTAFPQTAETLFAALAAVGNQRAPGLSSALMMGLLLFVTWSLAKRCGLDTSRSWWAATIVVTMPAVIAGAQVGFVDVFYALYVLAALRVGLDAERPMQWAVFGLLSGLAMGTKYTGLTAFPLLIFCAALTEITNDRKISIELVKNMGIVVLVACAFAAPYYIRNWLILGCPIYPPPPGYTHFCSPKYLPANAIAEFHKYITKRGTGLGRGLLPFLLLPFNLTYHTANFHGAGGIGICPLALGSIGALASRRNRVAKVMAIFGLLLVLVWYITQQESRFLIHFYVLTAVFSVIGWEDLRSGHRMISRYLAATIVCVSVSYGLFMIVKGRKDEVRAVLSSRYAAERRRKEIPYIESFEFLNHETSVRKVLILDYSVPPYYLDKAYLMPVGRWGERTLPGSLDEMEALAHARELGISHVLDVDSEVSHFRVDSSVSGLTLIFQVRNQRVYQVE